MGDYNMSNVKYTLLKHQDELEDDYYNNLDIQNENNSTFLKRLNINKRLKKFKYVLYLSFQLLLSSIIVYLYHKKESKNKDIIYIFYGFIMIIAIEITIVIYDISRISSKRILTKQE
tara:strand:+ start:299 stop:649 length:351 start_codon:yes stop_codon:yes gene_type:complete